LGSSLLEQAFFRAAEARAQAQSSAQPVLFDIQKVADHVYAALARPQPLLNSNAVIFENANDLLVVDAHSKPSAAAALAAQTRREVTDKPIRYIVNTHFHWDHTQGDPAYRHVAPHAEFIASETTRDLLSQLGTIRANESVEQASASLDGYYHRLESAKKPEERARLEQTIAEIKAYIAEMHGYTPVLPDITFDRTLVVHDKLHDLHLTFRGRGHTAGDVVVFCPQSKVIATGDLLHGWFPYIADGYPREWPATLASLREFPFEVVVGGHGRVQHGLKRLGQMSAYIAEVTEAVDAGKRKGQTVQELQISILPSSLRSLDADYREFLVSQSNDSVLTPDELIAAGVKTNISEVFARLDRG
jgi:glyoxylase-like metal-dependent hydrolase (beta-lactamase superfamily II)